MGFLTRREKRTSVYLSELRGLDGFRTVVGCPGFLSLRPGAKCRVLQLTARETPSRMSRRVLLVEDTEDNRRIVRDLLQSAGYELLEAEDGAAGVAMAAEFVPGLILMDVQLPVMDGYEATRRIKANPKLRHIPIIAVTSYALSGDEAKARAAGCDGYVAKPFSPRLLLAKVREYLPQP